MYIRNPETNEWEEVFLPPTGDTYPIGMYGWFAGENAPTNWLRCDGQEISRTEYKELFNAIGTTYGVGDGSTTFNLPNVNLENRTLVGSSGDGEFSVGNTGGEKEHKLTIDEMPSHKHDITPSGATTFASGGSNEVNQTSGSRTYTFLGTGFTGGSQPHNNMQPYMASVCCIKAKQSVGLVGNVVSDMNAQGDNDVAPTKVIKEYVDNQPQVIYCKKSADMNTNNTYKKIDDWTQLIKVGNELSVKNGKVVIGKNIHNVKISSKFRLNGATGQMVFTYLLKNDLDLTGSWSINSLGGSDLTMVNETIINVSEGDTITASIYGDGGTKVQSDATTLIVEKIN